MKRKIFINLCGLLLATMQIFLCAAQKTIDQKCDSVLKLMTLEEKIGQMNHEVYLKPFKAAADAGAATFMNSFNDLNGIPASGNKYLQRDILKGEWKFKGFIVSDWGSIGEMINHGYVKDNYEAALAAVTAGSDMDMESRSYI